MRTLGTIFLAGAALLATGCVADHKTVPLGSDYPSRPPAATIQGHVTVPAGDGSQDFTGGDCVGDRGFEDISEGAQVKLVSREGYVLAVGRLNHGIVSEVFPDDGSVIAGMANKCSFAFRIEGVSPDMGTYGIAVGNVFRGTNYFTSDQIKEPIDLALAG
jgi:hypothetical protein